MANIASYLQKILEAVYGEEVRGSIHDAIAAMNAESSTAMEAAVTAQNSASNSAEAAKLSQTKAEQQATAAQASAAAAKGSEDKAKGSEDKAKSSELVAGQKATEAQAAQAAAQLSAQAASASERNAQAALDSAGEAAVAAASSEASAAESAETAQQYSGNPPKIDPDTHTWWIWNADEGNYEDTHMTSEIPGPQGVSITDIQLTEGDHSPGTIDVYTISMSDGSSHSVTVWNGRNGEGVGDILGISFDLVISKSSWAEHSATVADSRFIASGAYKYFVDADESCREEYLSNGVGAKDVTTSGYITFINNTDPSGDLTVNILRLELGANKEP